MFISRKKKKKENTWKELWFLNQVSRKVRSTNCRHLPLSAVSLFLIPIALDQLQPENIKWNIPEINNS